MAMNPSRYPSGVSRAKSGRRADLGGLFVRSSWEANWARYLNLLQSQGAIKGWRYEKKTFEFAAIKRGSRFYTPDFEVEENDGRIVYHEVKGYMDQRSATKLKRMKKYFPDVELILVRKKELAEVRRKFGALIPHWEGA